MPRVIAKMKPNAGRLTVDLDGENFAGTECDVLDAFARRLEADPNSIKTELKPEYATETNREQERL